MSSATLWLGDRQVGEGQPVYVIAELSANHGGSIARARELIAIAADCGADAVKLQTYRPETMTLPLDRPPFTVRGGTLWDGRQLFDLYREAQTPWEWHEELFGAATRAGIACFSTPFDRTAVDFLEQFDPPAHKIASFEILDLDLISAAAATGRPLVISTGMASETEIDRAVGAARTAGASQIALLRCNSAYPASPAEMDLHTITAMKARWGLPVGLSDHTLGLIATVVAVSLGSCIVEKHLTRSRDEGGPDSAFSIEPDELRALVAAIREAEAALGSVRFGPSKSEQPSLAFRRSLWFVNDLSAGDVVARGDIAALRPAGGMAPDRLESVVGRRLRSSVRLGDPVTEQALVSDDE
jgi:N-acetylneuraminate synthase